MLVQTQVSGDERDDRADGVRRLGRHIECEVAQHRIPVGHTAAGLDGGDVDTWQVDVLRDDDLGAFERGVGGSTVANFPVPDVIGFLLAVEANDRRAGLHRLERVHNRVERLVVHLYCCDTIGSGVARGRNDGCDLLGIVQHGVHGQDHLAVAHQRRHPFQFVRHQVCARDDGGYTRHFQRRLLVDALDFCVREWAAHDVEIEHARQLDVVDVLALAAQEARVLFAFDRMAHAVCDAHAAPPEAAGSLILPAAYLTASTMFT